MSVETAATAPPDSRVTGPVLDLVVPLFDEEAATHPATTVGGTPVYDLTADRVSMQRLICRDPD